MAVILDIALSAGFQILAGLLKPRRVNNTPDNLPTQQFGEPIPRGWGTFSIPGVLMFAGDPNLNGTVQLDAKNSNNPSENASYACFLHSNPTNPKLLTLKLNSLTVATRDNAKFPLTSEIRNNRITDSLGLLRFDQYNLRFYDGNQTTTDPMIARNGFGDLQYRGQCYVVIADALREVYGGRATAVGTIVEDNIEVNSSTVTGTKGFGDSPVEVEWSSNFGVFNAVNVSSFSVARGFQYSAQAAYFRGSGSIAPGAASTTVLVAGTLSQYRLPDGAFNVQVKPSSNPRFTTSVGQAGKFPFVSYPASFTPSLTSSVIVGRPQSELREIFLAQPGLSPFYSVNGVIFSSQSQQVGLCGNDEDVLGWNGQVYHRSTTVPNSSQVTVTSTATTKLSRILRGLLSSVPGLFFSINFSDDPVIIGFSTTNPDITADIANLLACYNKFVYQSRAGVLEFIDYPTSPVDSAIIIPPSAHVSEPEFKIEPYDKIPGALNFSYQDTEREYDISSVRVGNDTTLIDNFAVNIACDRAEGLRLANNLILRIRSQTISGSLHLKPYYNQIEPGSICLIQALNSGGVDLPVLITRVETGVDLTARFEYINYQEPAEVILPVPNAYGVGVNPVVLSPSITLLDTEKRSLFIGLGYVTNQPGGVIRSGVTSRAIVTAERGLVGELSFNSALILVPQASPQVGQEVYIQDSVSGEGSWCKIQTSSMVGTDQYQITFISGLYGSNSFSTPLNKFVYFMREDTVLADNYSSTTIRQNGVTETFSYTTRKRLVEPRLTGVLFTGTSFTAYRSSSTIDRDDFDFSEGTTPPTFWWVTNVTTNFSMMIFSFTSTFDVPNFVLNKGDTLTIQQVDQSNQVLEGAYLNTYIVS